MQEQESPMYPVLAIDCAGEFAGIMLQRDGNSPRTHLTMGAKKSGEHILQSLRELLLESSLHPRDLATVVCNEGPGSFTGLRIASGITQGLASAIEHLKPHQPLMVITCNTFAIAVHDFCINTAPRSGLLPKYILLSIDARAQEVYWQIYKLNTGKHTDNGISYHAIQPVRVDKPAEVLNIARDVLREPVDGINSQSSKSAYSAYNKCILGIGNGFDIYPQLGKLVNGDIINDLGDDSTNISSLHAMIDIACKTKTGKHAMAM